MLGWGKTRYYIRGGSSILQYVWLPVISGKECKRRLEIAVEEYAKVGKNFKGRYYDNTICTWTTNKDSCEGDSGGPVLKNEGDKLVLVGLTSWGPNECGKSQVKLSFMYSVVEKT